MKTLINKKEPGSSKLCVETTFDDQYIVTNIAEFLTLAFFCIFFIFQMFFYGFYKLVDPKSTEDQDILKLIILTFGILSMLCALVFLLLFLIRIGITIKNKKLIEELDSESEIKEESNEPERER